MSDCGEHCYRRGDIREMYEEKCTLILISITKLFKVIMVIMNDSFVFKSSYQRL